MRNAAHRKGADVRWPAMAESSTDPVDRELSEGQSASQGQTNQTRDDRVAWGVTSKSEHRWPASAAVMVAIVLQVVLPQRVIQGLGPRWLIPTLEGVLLIALIVANPGRINRESSFLRGMSLVLIAMISLANVVALGELVGSPAQSVGALTHP